MSKIIYVLIVLGLFIYYLYRVIKKKKNPALNGAAAAIFGIFVFKEIIPYISKFIGKFFLG